MLPHRHHNPNNKVPLGALAVIPQKYLTLVMAAVGFAGIILLTFYALPAVKQETNLAYLRASNLDFFAASDKWIVFSVPVGDDVIALAVINRATDQRKLVWSKGAFLAYPRFSADGERVLVVRGGKAAPGSEILSCTADDWNCRVVVQPTAANIWPVEVRKDVVLYSGSERSAAKGGYSEICI